MANINDYIEIIKFIPKGINSFISPNINQDIENLQRLIRAVKYNRVLVRYNMRIIKLKKHKFLKKVRKVKIK